MPAGDGGSHGGVKVLVAGMVAGTPHQAGASWAVLQYLEGLLALGHDALLVEPVPTPALRGGATLEYFRSLALPAGRAALLAAEGRQSVGVSYEQLRSFAREADVLLNISGLLRDESLLEQIPVRAFVDLDPGFNQVWATQGHDMGLGLHTHFVTVGGNIGRRGCPIPTCGRDWIPILPPVHLERWPFEAEPPRRDALTTIGHWRSYGSLEHDGVRYGQRAHSLRELLRLPRLVRERIELALGIDAGEQRDLEALAAHGWHLADPARVASTPDAYRSFVAGSKAELCVAKSGYVASRSGWFSDRSACYLASGRPVVAQRTGFELRLPCGEGLLAYGTVEEAAAAVGELASSPHRHRLSARELAEEHLDARKVLASLLEELGCRC